MMVDAKMGHKVTDVRPGKEGLELTVSVSPTAASPEYLPPSRPSPALPCMLVRVRIWWAPFDMFPDMPIHTSQIELLYLDGPVDLASRPTGAAQSGLGRGPEGETL